MPTLLSALSQWLSRAPWRGADWRRRGLIGLCLLLLAPSPLPLALIKDFRTAQAATADKDYRTAADALADAAERLPYAGPVVYRAGLAELSAGRFELAVQHIRLSTELDGWTPEKHMALGDAYLGQDNRSAATDQWALALKDRPTDMALLQRLANNYEATGHYTETIAILGSLVALGQATPEMYYRLALLTAATAPDEALARLAVVAAMSPDRAANAKVLTQAIQAGQQANDEAYTFGLTGFAFVQLQEWPLAELALTRAVALNPNFSRAYAYLGYALDEQHKDGLPAYQTALKLESGSPWINYMLGLHWRRLGDGNKAIDYFQRALGLDAQNPAFAAELATTYASQNDLTEAEHWFREAVRLSPQDPHFWLLLARFYCDQNYHIADEGLPAARQAAALAPNDASAVDALGCALWLTGDLVNAEKTVQRALALDPNLPSAYYHLGQLYLKQDQAPAAEAAFNHTLALDPQGAYGNLAFQALAGMTTPLAPAATPTP